MTPGDGTVVPEPTAEILPDTDSPGDDPVVPVFPVDGPVLHKSPPDGLIVPDPTTLVPVDADPPGDNTGVLVTLDNGSAVPEISA